LLATHLETPVASAAELAATACLVSCPLYRARWAILPAQLGVGVFLAIHYGLFGVAVAALVNVLGGSRRSRHSSPAVIRRSAGSATR